MSGHSRTTLFLMEQLIVITVFAVCAAICTAILVQAYLTANHARDINHALIAAKNGAEVYRALGNLEETAAALGGRAYGAEKVAVYYNPDWKVSAQSEAAYVMRLIRPGGASPPYVYELSVQTISGEEIIAFTVAAGGGYNSE